MSRTIKAESDKIKSRGGDRVKKTGEVFTPLDLCIKMIKQIPQHILEDPESTFLDNSCGDGNFLVALTKVLGKYHDKQHIVDNMIYGVDLMPDNIAQVKRRLGVSEDHPHFVCADALTYDYTFGG
jgi:ubiquinone/menaquinone biosynthesis C-methylase UbiE